MKTRILCAALAALFVAGAATAQTNTGTTIGSFLEIEPNARVAAMGNAGVSAYDGLQAVYYNPASIGSVSGTELLFSHNTWIAGITYDYAAVALPIASLGNAYATITSLNSGDIDVRTVAQPLGTGERFDVTDMAIALGFGRQLSSRFSAGVQVNFMQETIWHTSASTMTVSLGTLYRLSENGLRIGSSLSNFGTRAAYDGRDLRFTYDNVPGQNGANSALPGVRYTDQFAVPLMFRVGLAMPFRLQDNNRLWLAADAFHPNDNSESVSVGAEYLLNDVLALRAGYQNLFLQDSEVGTTLGAGLKGQVDSYRYRVDYAWADQGRLGHSNRVSVAMSF
jgi:hypothetical protein